MSAAHVLYRPCACGCGRQFTPAVTQPSRRYIYGHGPKKLKDLKQSETSAEREAGRRKLNYGIALQTLEREKAELDAEIERLDEQIETRRAVMGALQSRKEAHVERHALVVALIDGMRGIGAKS